MLQRHIRVIDAPGSVASSWHRFACYLSYSPYTPQITHVFRLRTRREPAKLTLSGKALAAGNSMLLFPAQNPRLTIAAAKVTLEEPPLPRCVPGRTKLRGVDRGKRCVEAEFGGEGVEGLADLLGVGPLAAHPAAPF